MPPPSVPALLPEKVLLVMVRFASTV